MENTIYNNIDSKVSNLISSDLDYEKMVTYLCFDNSTVAILNCDKGEDKPEIYLKEEYSTNVIWIFNLNEFINCLNCAYKNIIESKNSSTNQTIESEIFKLEIIKNLEENKLTSLKITSREILVAMLTCTRDILETEIFIYKQNVNYPIWKLNFVQFFENLKFAYKTLIEINKEI